MVRKRFDPSRLKHRPYEDDRGNEGTYNPGAKSWRDFSRYSIKPPLNSREIRGRGRRRPPYTRRHLPAIEYSDTHGNHWRSQNEDSARHLQSEPYHVPQRHSPIRYNQFTQSDHHTSHNPARGQQSHGGPSMHGNSSNRRSPERHFRNQPADRRSGVTSTSRGSFRGRKRQSGFPYREQHNRDRRPRDRSFEHSGHGGNRWNEPGSFHHPPNEEYRSSWSQRNLMKMDESGSERYTSEVAIPAGWSSEQDSRHQRGPRERQGSRPHSRERADDVPHSTPYRPPPWKGGSSSESSYRSTWSQTAGFRKKTTSVNTSGFSQEEHSITKFPRRKMPYQTTSRPFGGRLMTRGAKSRFVKHQHIQAQSLMQLKLPPMIKTGHRLRFLSEQENGGSTFAIRKKRFEPNAVPLRQRESRGPKRQSLQRDDGDANKSSGDYGPGKEQVESRRSLITNRSSPIEKSDLVVLSHWPPGPSSSSKDCSVPKESSPILSYNSSDENTTPKRRLSRNHYSRSPENQSSSSSERSLSRSQDVMEETKSTKRPVRRPGPYQRFKNFGDSRRTGPEPSSIRRPDVETRVSRSFTNQTPVFRKSVYIMHKYRNMRASRQRARATADHI